MRLLLFLINLTIVSALMPHAVFSRNDAIDMYRRFMPPISSNGVIYTNEVKRRIHVLNVLKDTTSFMVLGWDGINMNVFFCTSREKDVHKIDVCVVHEYEDGDALFAFSEWHEATFGSDFELQLS